MGVYRQNRNFVHYNVVSAMEGCALTGVPLHMGWRGCVVFTLVTFWSSLYK